MEGVQDRTNGGNAMTAPVLPAGKDRVEDATAARAADRPRTGSPWELPAPAEREYLREHIVLGYN